MGWAMAAKATETKPAATKAATKNEPVTVEPPAAPPLLGEVAPGQVMSEKADWGKEVAPGQYLRDVNLAGAQQPYEGDCVVDDGTTHNGNAVGGGKVCSAHENRYYANGKPRTA